LIDVETGVMGQRIDRRRRGEEVAEVERMEGSGGCGGGGGEEKRGRLVMFLHGKSRDIVDQMVSIVLCI